jgi:ABC-2 type transport system ATP-binding protein
MNERHGHVLEFRDVSRHYGGPEVLRGVSFAAEAGQVIGLLGRNGAGKTTLLQLAMGMLRPHAGQVRVFGLDPCRDPVAARKRIGYVSEDQELPGFLRVREIVAMYRHYYPRWDEAFAGDLARRFELPPDRRIKDLSRGQARQVALLCAVSHRPELLLLDEPAGGLDPAARRQFLETSLTLLNETGSTIVFSSHHMGDVERMASRLIMLHENQKWIDSDLEDIREGYCLAQLPAGDGVDPQRLLTLPACLCVRRHGDAVHAVFELQPGACERTLVEDLGLAGARCRPLGLEEMFLELAGREA